MFTQRTRDIQELELHYASANGHDMSGFEQCVDQLIAVCIYCGAETVIGLDRHLSEATGTDHLGTQLLCPGRT